MFFRKLKERVKILEYYYGELGEKLKYLDVELDNCKTRMSRASELMEALLRERYIGKKIDIVSCQKIKNVKITRVTLLCFEPYLHYIEDKCEKSVKLKDVINR